MMRASRTLWAADLVNVFAFLGLPWLAAFAVPHFQTGCTSSMDRFNAVAFTWTGLVAATTALIHLIARSGLRRSVVRVFAFTGVALFFTISMPSLDAGSIDRVRQRRTVAEMKAIAEALDDFHRGNGTYPAVSSIQQLEVATPGNHFAVLDGWGRPFILTSSTRDYTLISLGLCGDPPPTMRPGPVASVGEALVIVNGRFVRYPQQYGE